MSNPELLHKSRSQCFKDLIKNFERDFKSESNAEEIINFAKLFCLRLSREALSLIPSSDFARIIQSTYKFFRQSLGDDLTLKAELYQSEQVPHGAIYRILLGNRSFIVDSINELIHKTDNNLYLMVHPIITPQSSDDGKQLLFAESNPDDQRSYSLVTFILHYQTDAERKSFEKQLGELLESVIAITDDYKSLTREMERFTQQDLDETTDVDSERQKFFEWLVDGNSILLGSAFLYKEQLQQDVSWDMINRPKGLIYQKQYQGDEEFPNKLAKYGEYFLGSQLTLNIFELAELSQIHKPEPIQMVIAKTKNKEGRTMVYFFVLLFTNKTRYTNPLEIPTARNKLNYVLEEFTGSFKGHLYKEMLDYFTLLPKNELFRMDREELTASLEQLQLFREYTSAKLFTYLRADRNYLRLTICINHNNFSPSVFEALSKSCNKKLEQDSEIKYYISFGRNVYCYFIYWYQNKSAINNLSVLEHEAQAISTSWNELLKIKVNHLPLDERELYQNNFLNCFPSYYQALFTPEEAVFDMEYLHKLLESGLEQVDLRPGLTGSDSVIFLYSHHKYKLTAIMPKLINLSLIVSDENTFKLDIAGQTSYIYAFYVEHKAVSKKEYPQIRLLFQELLLAILADDSENDPLNGLLFQTGFTLKIINLFMLYRNYYNQIGNSFSKKSIDTAFLINPKVILKLWEYFSYKFDLNLKFKQEALDIIEKDLRAEIFEVKTVSEDVIFKSIFNLMQASVRTNYFISKGKEAMAIKVQSGLVEHMPMPKPLYEIYIHATHMEGVHLRGSKIARGGIRHSDRADDFRTEILGLMKTQMMKNVVIVPEGSKGGFFAKRATSNRQELMAEGKLQYQVFMNSILSLTDNIKQGKSVQNAKLRCFDEVDTYLVVAADKGTAHLSDTANEVSQDRKFWLNDAFASGGSQGYDHKVMGITARGAWECVKLHFLERNFNVQTTPFTVVGIGDMSGDVFGNGMLLSDQIKLTGAFNHIHIFIDPTPDHTTGIVERKRLFTTPGSQWKDYNPELISKGGGIFDRSAKSIKLTPQMKKLVSTDLKEVTGEELIRLLLKAPVDLLWNGGIGTYIKSSSESHQAVGDPSNDHVRINAAEVRAKVIGEGGNLGLTQRARVEYAIKGGQINTDAIDNSAGVDTSDHEVNLKILVSQMQESKVITSEKHRNDTLQALTEEVGKLVLIDNQMQGRILSMDVQRSIDFVDPLIDQINYLSRNKLLDRRTENLTSNKQIHDLAQQGIGIPRPDLAILLSYTKMYFYKQIISSPTLDDPFFNTLYLNYYPKSLQKQFKLLQFPHPLKREIIGTMWINQVVNQAGVTLLSKVLSFKQVSIEDLLLTYTLIDQIFELPKLRADILHELEVKDLNSAYQILTHIEDLVLHLLVPLLASHAKKPLTFQDADTLKFEVQGFIAIHRSKVDRKTIKKTEERFTSITQVSKVLLESLTEIELMRDSLYVIDIARELNIKLEDAYILHEQLGEALGLSKIERSLLRLKEDNSWSKRHRGLLLSRILRVRAALGQNVMALQGKSIQEKVDLFISNHAGSIEYLTREMKEFDQLGPERLSAISVLLGELENIGLM